MDSSDLQASHSLMAAVGERSLLPYIRPVGEALVASGPDGFPRAFISINLPASKAPGLNGFLKTPVRPVCHRDEMLRNWVESDSCEYARRIVYYSSVILNHMDRPRLPIAIPAREWPGSTARDGSPAGAGRTVPVRITEMRYGSDHLDGLKHWRTRGRGSPHPASRAPRSHERSCWRGPRRQCWRCAAAPTR